MNGLNPFHVFHMNHSRLFNLDDSLKHFIGITPWKTEIIHRALGRCIATIAGTGHRPDKISPGYSSIEKNTKIIVPIICDYLEKIWILLDGAEGDYIEIVSGMAQGWDIWLALAALEDPRFRLVAVVPCPNQSSKWPQAAQELHLSILKRAHEIVTVREFYSLPAMQDRNIYMVNRSDHMAVLHDGSAGGTMNCLKYSRKIKRPEYNFWPIVSKAIKA